jgi:NAD(P)-dependent dehydrogenase (short-subunit alcohol dehydrogenase family)
MEQKLRDKTALVTGASSGIGQEIARLFIAQGAAVFLAGRSEQRLADTREGSEAPHQASIRTVDLSDQARIDSFFQDINQSIDRLDILVNCAGYYRLDPLLEASMETCDRMMAVNFTAPLRLIQHSIPLMRAAGGGSIINIASTLGTMIAPNCGLYSISKAALLMLTRVTALEHAVDGIRCNSLSPGVVDTPIFSEVMPDDQIPGFLEQMTNLHPLGRIGNVQDIARAALFLASDDASWVTGINFPVDGGISLT